MDTAIPTVDYRLTAVQISVLDIDEHQQSAAIEDAIEIKWRGLTIVMAETCDGRFVYGAAAQRSGTEGSPTLARGTCWTRLLHSLASIRMKWAERSLTQPVKW